MGEFNDLERYIEPFNPNRNMTMVYGQPRQLILKNCAIPDGVTIIGTYESIMRFMDAAMPDTSDYMVYAGFYPWKLEVV